MKLAGPLRIAAALAVGVSSATAQRTGTVPLDDGWELSGEGARIEPYRGVQSIRLRTGQAVRRDVMLRDGTIEFDLAMAPHRSFVYLRFRMADDRETEEIYFRPHKSSLPDAIQYSPVWRGESNWQLYHGDWGTAPASFVRDDWMRVRVVLQGRRAAVFLGDTARPAMVVPLGREPIAGPIAFQSFVPQGSAPGGGPLAAFANVVVRPGYVPYTFETRATPPASPGLVRRWQLSPAFPADSVPIAALPDPLLVGRERWPAYDVEPHGVLVVGRYLQRPAPGSGTVARLVLRADRPGLQRLDLGYSDYVTVFVAGRPVFAGDAHYSFDRPRQEGLIGLTQAAVWLPLSVGDNEILLAVSDGFGGWGLTASLDPAGGARVVAPGR